MNTKQANKLAMYAAAYKVLRENSALWSKVPAMANAEHELDSGIKAINDILKRQTRDLTGITIDKKLLKSALVDAVYEVASAIAAFAKKAASNELRKEAGLTHTEIARKRDSVLVAFIAGMAGHARTHLKALEPYGINASTLVNLHRLAEAYSAKAPATRVAKNNRMADTKALAELFSKTDELLKEEIDRLIVQFKKTHPLFFNAYTAARAIIDMGKASKYVDFTIPPFTTITIDRFVSLSTFTNTGTVALELFGDGVEGLWVAPGEQVQVQVNSPSIQVQNLHMEATAHCRARVTSLVPVKKNDRIASKVVSVEVQAGQSKRVEGIIPGTEVENMGPAAVTVCDCADPGCGITDDDQPCGYEQTIDAMNKGVLDTQQSFVNISNKDASKAAKVKLRVYEKKK